MQKHQLFSFNQPPQVIYGSVKSGIYNFFVFIKILCLHLVS